MEVTLLLQWCVCFAVLSCLSGGQIAEGRGIYPPERVSAKQYIEGGLSAHITDKRTPFTPFPRLGRSVLPSSVSELTSTEPIYLDLVLVADRSVFLHYGGDVASVRAYSQRVADRLTHLYQPLNIAVSLVETVVWTERDETPVSTDIRSTLRHFTRYTERLQARIPHHNAQLLTKVQFPGHVGMGYVGTVCRPLYSCGVNSVSDEVEAAGSAVAHEMGHNLGMLDEPQEVPCQRQSVCPPWGCIMATGRGEVWSECSQLAVRKYFQNGRDHCLRGRARKELHVRRPRPQSTHLHTPSRREQGVSPPPPAATVVVKVLLLVDSNTRSLLQDQGDDLHEYCSRLVHAVNNVYTSIKVTAQLAAAIPLTSVEESGIVKTDYIDVTLANLGKYARERASSSHHVVILLTRQTFPKGGDFNARTVTGKAYTRAVCSRGTNVAVVSTAQAERLVQLTLAHELGHLLGMRHDEYSDADSTQYCPDNSRLHVMAGVIGDDTRSTLSPCSISTWHKFLQSKQADCLRNPVLMNEETLQSDQPVSPATDAIRRQPSAPTGVTVVLVHLVAAESTWRARGGEQYCRKLWQQVHDLYLPIAINIQLSDINHLPADEEKSIVNIEDIQKTLNSFTNYASELRRRKPEEYHITILLADTSYPRIVNGRRTETRIMGRANSDEVCQKEGSVGVVSTAQESDARVVVTLAHEIGHLLGMNDDNTVSETPGCPEPSGEYIMSGVVINSARPRWSRCSINTWNKFYGSDEARCLRNQTPHNTDVRRTQHGNVLQVANERNTLQGPKLYAQNVYQSQNNQPQEPTQIALTRTIRKPTLSIKDQDGRSVVNVMLVVADSTFYGRGNTIYTYLDSLIEAADSYYVPLGVRVRQAGILRIDSRSEQYLGLSPPKKLLDNFKQYMSQQERDKKLPKYHVAILISDVLLQRPRTFITGTTYEPTCTTPALSIVTGDREHAATIDTFIVQVIRRTLRVLSEC